MYSGICQSELIKLKMLAIKDRAAFKAELRTYFGLSFAQVDEMEQNWNSYYNNNAAIIN
jgi:hypothetical protein